jgi:hypothetical protein
MISINELWRSSDAQQWESALNHYWDFVQPRNLKLERAFENLDLKNLQAMNQTNWYIFLRDEYFRWKYTAPNRYASTTRLLRRYEETNTLNELDEIRIQLLGIDPNDIQSGLEIANKIRGLGPPGASGLLALMYPKYFGTIDQFCVKALRLVDGLPEINALHHMNPDAIKLRDGILLVSIMRRKADTNNKMMKSNIWTPRMIDKILWTYGR